MEQLQSAARNGDEIEETVVIEIKKMTRRRCAGICQTDAGSDIIETPFCGIGRGLSDVQSIGEASMLK